MPVSFRVGYTNPKRSMYSISTYICHKHQPPMQVNIPCMVWEYYKSSWGANCPQHRTIGGRIFIQSPIHLSKVVSTHLWNTPEQPLPTGCLGCAISGCVVIFLEIGILLEGSGVYWSGQTMIFHPSRDFREHFGDFPSKTQPFRRNRHYDLPMPMPICKYIYK